MRPLTRALLACCAAVLVLGGLASALVASAPEQGADRLTPGLTLLGIGQAGALAGAGVVALGLRRALAQPPEPAGLVAVRRLTGQRLGAVAFGVVVACVVAALGWTLLDPARGLGAVLAALVSAQVAALLVVLRRHLERTR